MHDLSENFCYDDFFRKTHARLYFELKISFLNYTLKFKHMFQVAQQCKENIYAIQTLKDFQHLEENKDQGINVREKAKAVVALLKDDDRYY